MAILLRSQERASTEENFCAISFRTRESGDKRQTRSLSALALYVGPGDTTCKRAATTCPAERVNCCLLDFFYVPSQNCHISSCTRSMARFCRLPDWRFPAQSPHGISGQNRREEDRRGPVIQ